MVSRCVYVLSLVALTAAVLAPTQAQAQEVALPRGAAHLLEQVLEVAHAVTATPTSSARHDADASDVDASDVAAGDASEAAGDDASDAATTDEVDVPSGGVIPYARTVVQLFGRGVPVSPLDDMPARSGTTLNVRPCHGGCIFRLRVGF